LRRLREVTDLPGSQRLSIAVAFDGPRVVRAAVAFNSQTLTVLHVLELIGAASRLIESPLTCRIAIAIELYRRSSIGRRQTFSGKGVHQLKLIRHNWFRLWLRQ